MPAMKRKADDPLSAKSQGKRPARNDLTQVERFRPGLFDDNIVNAYTAGYASSAPYKHAVIPELINDDLLRAVRQEITQNIHFTPKETDIYKIHQSGDLANLDGLPEEALEKLPSLLKLRDALYGEEFRTWVSRVSGAGPVSGQKTDMAVNVYVPGCHLLCHDDVIGSRRVSYILYLTDPDQPWQASWGGALRLYPTDEREGADGKSYKVPRAEWSKVIPPAWNQLSFFTVQPGESFHDVEEVYHRSEGDVAPDGGRVRMAISGWFHIPQEGEDGFEPGLEERLAEKSSLQQLQGKAEEFDRPQPTWQEIASSSESEEDDDDGLTEKDLEFLLQFMTANYLTPDTVGELAEIFADESTLQLSNFLNQKFAARLKEHMLNNAANPSEHSFETSGPPHKHRYQYLHPSAASSSQNPYQKLLDELLTSAAFHRWLSLATSLPLARGQTILARRFRRGLDYQLAQGYGGENVQLEYTLSITPTLGWGANTEGEGDDEEVPKSNGHDTKAEEDENEDNIGGYELYMAGDEDDEDEDEEGGVEIPTMAPQSHTGAGDRRSSKRNKADPAIYRAAADDEDDGILFSNPASWNSLSIVLRDRGTLKFVKYVSQSAQGDRYDIVGSVEVEDDDGESDGDEDVEAA